MRMRMRILKCPVNLLVCLPPNLKEKVANQALQINLLAIVNGFANEIARILFSLRKILANARCDKIR